MIYVSIFFKIFVKLCSWLCVGSVHMWVQVLPKTWREHQFPQSWSYRQWGVYPALMLGTKLGSSARAIYACNHLFRPLSNDTFETESYLGWVRLKLTKYLKMRLTLSFLASASAPGVGVWMCITTPHYVVPELRVLCMLGPLRAVLVWHILNCTTDI